MNVQRRQPLIVLVAAVGGIVWFSTRFSMLDTVALLVCGLVAGGALAALAAARQKAR